MSPSTRSLRRITPRVWIPPTSGALYKIEITRNDGSTTDDITDLIFEGELIDGVTDTIGSFEFTVDNSAENFTGIWTGNEVIRIYIDYATTATTARFRGKIEKVSYRDSKIKITGRTTSASLLDITVTQSFNDTETSLVLKSLLDTYATNFTQTNINATSTNVTVNWSQKPLWEAIQQLCHSSGFDAYLDVDLDFHFFESGTRTNTTDAVVHDSNLFEVGDFARDKSLIKNRIIVYGKDIEGLPLFKTAEDSDSISNDGLKELIIKDENITTEIQCQERADYELELSKDAPIVGDVKSIGLATIQPGEKVQISAPLSNLPPAYYKIVSYKHKFEGLMTTTLTVEKEAPKLQNLMRDRISGEQNLSNIPNPNEMRFSWNFDYDNDSGTHTNTRIINGVLQTATGQSSGTWISEGKTTTSNVTVGEIKVSGSALSGTIYYISIDNGATWTVATPNTATNLTPPGTNLRLKVELNSESTQINSLALLYK